MYFIICFYIYFNLENYVLTILIRCSHYSFLLVEVSSHVKSQTCHHLMKDLEELIMIDPYVHGI